MSVYVLRLASFPVLRRHLPLYIIKLNPSLMYIPSSNSRHQALDIMSLETPLSDSASSPVGQDKSAVDSQMDEGQSSPAQQQGGAEGEEFPGAASQMNSLKRSSPDEREEVGDEDRYSKRPKEDDVSDPPILIRLALTLMMTYWE